MRVRYPLGTSAAEAGGRHPMSCSKGFSGAPSSNLISAKTDARFVRSLNIGPVGMDQTRTDGLCQIWCVHAFVSVCVGLFVAGV